MRKSPSVNIDLFAAGERKVIKTVTKTEKGKEQNDSGSAKVISSTAVAEEIDNKAGKNDVNNDKKNNMNNEKNTLQPSTTTPPSTSNPPPTSISSRNSVIELQAELLRLEAEWEQLEVDQQRIEEEKVCTDYK